MGCLFALLGGLAPRFALFIYWIMRPAQVDAAFDTWIFPLLGIIFLPLATLLYAVLWTVGGLSGWYPYPFLDPNLQGGYLPVVLYVVGIAIATVGVGLLVIWAGRYRAARRARVPSLAA